mmetsp:Transcript_7289/g.16471  ORF Transcript_7289/g.16471 Transcript_7289/m.16471 type:complete len:99 (-) Transcript_7289:605-901(-)
MSVNTLPPDEPMLFAASAATSVPSFVVVVGGNSGRVRKREVNVTKLKAKVHWGTLPIASFSVAATNGVADAPTIVAVVAAMIDGEPKTADAHPTRQPL